MTDCLIVSPDGQVALEFGLAVSGAPITKAWLSGTGFRSSRG
jgi:hypothetical protein